ncbi:MAG: hypothetical protein F4W95_09795 [Chloroflexi bacterium]|nr:hypothetical protein [Chloroflexota bacterium]MYD48762.1 hypothetical protein [Chloroflexota bacterium]
MATSKSDTPTVNADFAATVINRAAEIVAGAAPTALQECGAYSALLQARDEFMAAETQAQNKIRTYGLPHLLPDLRQYITDRYPEYADSFSPITLWSCATNPMAVAETLREAAADISVIVEERTRMANKFDAMSDKELREYDLMRKAAIFLTQQGLTVNVAWDRENPNDPIDYRATIDGVTWAFELTELRLDPKENYHRKVGHPNDKRGIAEQLDLLAMPLPQMPDGPDTLQTALNDAIKHGRKPSKLTALNGAKYCLILHNQQFLYASDWDAATMPDISAFDAVLVLHQEIYPLVETWEVLRNGFGKPMRSHNIKDLGDIIAFKNSNRTHRSNPERVKAALRRIQALELTEDDILAAIAETRAERSGQ